MGLALAAVDAPLLDAAIRAHVASALDVPDHDVEIRSNGLGIAFPCGPSAALKVEGEVGALTQGFVDLRVRGVERGEECGNFRLRVQVAVWVKRPVAAKAVAAGQTVPLELSRVELGRLRGDPVDPDMGPYLAIAPIRKGEPVTLHRVRARPDRVAGSTVTVIAGSGGLLIRATGRLLDDARTGATVRVAIPATGGVVEGVLRPDGMVELRRTL